MPDYAKIYDDVFTRVKGYRSPLGSPGLRTALRNADLIRACGSRTLDVGCGFGYVVEALRNPPFKKSSQGCDISKVACDEANARLGIDTVHLIQDGALPFDDTCMDLVTCFDVMEHLDGPDIIHLKDEILRVTNPGGLIILNVSLRPSSSKDLNGESLHRTVRPPQWWDDIFSFDRYEVDRSDQEMTGFLTR
ncbi:23S rRNA (guanine(745)-N(1))-methyltransferase [compost metagenome]